MHALRRMIGVCAAATVVIAGSAVVMAAPAVAQTGTTITPTTWATTDSAAPHKQFVRPSGDMPVGTFVDPAGISHTSKFYVTFDLSTVKKSDVLQSTLSTTETAATDCTKPRQTQVWLTATAPAPTWADQPAEQTQLAGGSPAPCPVQVFYDATSVIHQAVASGRLKVTFVFRIADAQQSDPAYGRRYDPQVGLGIVYDQAPAKPDQLTVNRTACSARPVPVPRSDVTFDEVSVAAQITDPVDSVFNTEWAWWPVDHPDQRTDVVETDGGNNGFPSRFALPTTNLTDATTYAWQVRGFDQFTTGPWSTACKFTTIFTPPANAPTVTSTDYPPTGLHGGTGVPGAITFNANGAKDVVGFDYGTNGDIPVNFLVPADHRGGTATIQFTPTSPGPQEVDVVGVDAAGNESPIGQYRFLVAPNAPKVACTPATGFIGTPRTCVFTPNGAGTIVSYSYQLNDGPVQTVPAANDGSASAVVTPTDQNAFGFTLGVTGNLSTGGHTESNQAFLQVDLGTPTVTQTPDNPVVGQPVQFTFAPGMPNVVSYTYTWEGNQTTVPAGPDGTATVALTTADQFAELDVFTTTSSGIKSGIAQDFVTLQSNQPTVTSTTYPEDIPSGGVTEPGTFVFSAPVAGAVSYTYSVDGGPATTVPAGSDGTASVVYTPTAANDHTMVVTVAYADGSVSQETRYFFVVNSVAPQVSCAATPPPPPGAQVTCTFTPVQPDVVSYVYSVNFGTEVTVPANPDGTGTATITIPAVQGFDVPLTVWSVNGAGLRSDPINTGIPFTASKPS